MKKEDYVGLVESARRYRWRDVKLYMEETGRQDWMLAYMAEPDAEKLTEDESRTINSILLDALEEAHCRRLLYWRRIELLDYKI